MPPAKPVAVRKRTRKRKRRAASSSPSSSSSSSSDSESEAEVLPTKKVLAKPIVPEESSSSDSSSSESDEDSESELEDKPPTAPTTLEKSVTRKPNQAQRRSPSPSPPPAQIPSFLPAAGSVGQDGVEQERIMKERFRKFWMSSIADGFKSDLEEIRKEPNLGTSRLSLLIDSLASGADIFASSSRRDKNAINEVEVILE